ncbi:Transglycosylase SLT domain-containing protein [Prauserella alba]|uniref:Transglycosylase SLT domain-containing protein n=1 Tax=Prauserella alba TaxID=176898 RepID=A0ABP4GBD3_9PSEU|nr:Transglycosylase SLT domain-containing protein [Prauserella alba]
MEWNDIPRNAKNIFARKALTPSSPKLNSSLKESVRGYAVVGLLATALAGVVGQAAFADEQVDPAATQRTADSAAQNAGVVRAHSHFGVAQLGEKASDSEKPEQTGGSGQAQPAGQGDDEDKQSGQQQAEPQQEQQAEQKTEKKAANKPAPKAKPKPAPKPQFDQVDRWINRAIDVLRQNDVPITHEKRDEIRTIIEKESSGDPRAINLWDSNAAKGIPSKGLMQTIDPTFDAHKLAGHDDIYNPVDNIIAGVRYTLDRYGSFDEHPGLSSMAGGGDYQGY